MAESGNGFLDVRVFQIKLVCIVTTANEKEAFRLQFWEVLDYELYLHAIQTWDCLLVNIVLLPLYNDFLIKICKEEWLKVFWNPNLDIFGHIVIIVGFEHLILIIISKKVKHADLAHATFFASDVNFQFVKALARGDSRWCFGGFLRFSVRWGPFLYLWHNWGGAYKGIRNF